MLTVRPLISLKSINAITSSVIRRLQVQWRIQPDGSHQMALDVPMHASRPSGWQEPASGELELFKTLLF